MSSSDTIGSFAASPVTIVSPVHDARRVPLLIPIDSAPAREVVALTGTDVELGHLGGSRSDQTPEHW